MTSISRTTLAAVAFAAFSGAAHAATFPIAAPGTEGLSIIVAHAGEVTATYQGNSASYSNNLYLIRPGAADEFLFNNHASPVGSTVSLGTFAAGTELVFRLEVTNTGYSYYTGAAASNPDGKAHARVEADWQPSETLVSFEDLYDGPFEFNDLSFSFTNTTAEPAPVPLPAGGLLLLSGVGAITVLRRRSKA